MTAGVKYFSAIKDIMEGRHNFATAQIAVCLTNRAPDVANDVFLTDAVEIAGGNGYPTGGIALQRTSSSQSGGNYKAVFGDPPVIQATGASIGPFRYVLIVNQDTGGSPLTPSAVRLIGYYDYGSSITMLSGETFTPDLDNINGLITGS